MYWLAINAIASTQLTMVGFHRMNVLSWNASVSPPSTMLIQNVILSCCEIGRLRSRIASICNVTAIISAAVA